MHVPRDGGISIQVSFNLKPDLLEQLDELKGAQSRSAFITEAIYERVTGPNADKRQLITEIREHKSTIEALRETIRRLEDEVAYNRAEITKLHDALAQRLLTDATPRRGLWARLLRREK